MNDLRDLAILVGTLPFAVAFPDPMALTKMEPGGRVMTGYFCQS
jgi:hypothetical protein